ncbi:hypothetical protein [Caballeronia sp. LZ034LL]|uniref:hypothetical protein n=1 Tax=Caballeronia sp. LZ034LL TaxID=3038567 RepID=UPI002863688A|nr:hypothetical protein [Caballeronia sp. LZ034LL]MDR5839300.1 hypothetical protein [Caballeronia sp. LZ034LL]
MSNPQEPQKRPDSALSVALAWFQAARPEPTSKQFHTQLGVHFEEVGEMLDTLSPLTSMASWKLHEARVALKALADMLKQHDQLVSVEPANRAKFLDSICDQIVTASGVGHHCGFPVLEAMHEVNESNFSKFVDGIPIFDENLKVKKGPYYWEANLDQFVPVRIPVFDGE